MWTFLYQLASPKYFYNKTKRYVKYSGFISAICLICGILWGLIFAPADYQQGDAFRIIYIHVPTAILSLSLYAGMGFLAVLLLVWRIKIAGLLLGITAELGASFAFIALVTGSIWGKPMWGTWWVWDARLTSELILFFIYLSVIAVSKAFAQKESAERAAAVLTLIGLIDLPIIHYSVYWWNTLHQGASLTIFAKPSIAGAMLYPLLCTLLGFIFYSIWFVFKKSHRILLLREKKQSWVINLIQQAVETSKHKAIKSEKTV